jgi:hypothetical protein
MSISRAAGALVGGAALLASFGLVGCSGGGDDDQLPTFHDLASAPGAIQTAAQAVVRIRTAGEAATGSFISSTGLLLTNNHVLGDSVCPIEGCSVELAFDFQRGQTLQPFVNAFAVPVAVDVGLDMAVVQIHSTRDDPTDLATPNFLTMVGHDPNDLLGTHITIVGHPESRLKKWTDGQVVDAYGDWFSSTAYILPGDSGSPALDDQGNLVGIVHRLPTGEDLISDDSVNVMAIGTASAPLLAAMAGQSLPAAMISIAAPTTSDAVVASDLVYLNGGAFTADVDDGPSDVLDLLGVACDAALARTNFASPDDLTAALTPCSDALIWIECRVDETPAAYQTVCPIDASTWTSRFEAMNSLWVAMNGNTDLSPVSFGVAQLQPSVAEGMQVGAASLQAALAAAGSPPIDFGLSNYLAAFDVAGYAGIDTLTWLRAYHQIPGYQDFGTSIASAYLWWWDNGVIERPEAIAALNALMRDPQISVGAKLFVDEYLYESGD